MQAFLRWIKSNKLVLFIIGIYVLLSVIKIEHPGVNNDQLMFVNAATLNPDNPFLWKSFHGFPTMVFPYIGALKSYFYMPIFYLFDVNIWSIRLPQIILIAISWLIFYKTLALTFNKKIAILTTLFLSIDSSLIIYSKTDQGPTVLEFFLKVLAVYFLYLFLTYKKSIFYFSIYPILALGIFNKLNFVWFANAFMVSFVVFYWQVFYNNFKKVDKLFPFMIFGIPCVLLIKVFINVSREVTLSYKDFSSPVALSNIYNNLLIFSDNLINVVNGNIFFKIIYGYNPTPFGNYVSGLILLIFVIGSYLLITRNTPFKKTFYFFLTIVILTFLQLLLTKKAVSAWHALSIYPFFTALFAISILQLYQVIKFHLLKASLIFLIVAIVFYQLIINYLYILKYSEPTAAVAYSASIYDLINFAKITPKKFICLDVDICNQLLSFNQEIGKYQEPFFFLDPPTYNYSFMKLANNFNSPNDYLYIAHGDANSHFLNLKQSFFKYLQESKINLIKIKEFKDGTNTTFEIYQVK